jgi:membrane protein implicated in regulation of membrane protease activity
MSPTTETKKQTALGLGGLFLLVCCIAGPAVLGAIGGAATGSIVVGAVVATVIAVSVYALLRRSKHRQEC